MYFTRLHFGRCFSYHYNKFIKSSRNVFHEATFQEIPFPSLERILIKAFVKKHFAHQIYFVTYTSDTTNLLVYYTELAHFSWYEAFHGMYLHYHVLLRSRAMLSRNERSTVKKKSKFIFPSIWEITLKTNNLVDLPPWL